MTETKHGHSPRSGKTRTYRIWKMMRARCRGGADARNYADRGITVDPAWDDFSVFLADMGEAPDGLTLDRIDNDGPYSIANCRWATKAVQSRNTRRNRWVVLRGETLTVKDAAAKLGVSDAAIINRVKRKGGTHQDAINALSGGIPAKVRDEYGRWVA